MSTARPTWLSVLLLFSLGSTQAGDIYRWVDEQGRTHVSDVVPERYQSRATRIDASQYELTPDQRRESAERAARERARAAEQPEPASADTQQSVAPAAPAAPRVVKRPVERVTESTDCATWWRLFHESEACFGPFRTVGGGIKPEAFDHCNEIPSPEPHCGPFRY